MHALSETFAEAGIWGYVLLFAFLTGLAAIPLVGLLRMAGRRAPTTLAVLAPSSLLLLGVLGWAVTLASPPPPLGLDEPPPPAADEAGRTPGDAADPTLLEEPLPRPDPDEERILGNLLRFDHSLAPLQLAAWGAAALGLLNLLLATLALLLGRRRTSLKPRPALHGFLPAAILLALAAVVFVGSPALRGPAERSSSPVLAALLAAFGAVVLGATGPRAPADEAARQLEWQHWLWLAASVGLAVAALLLDLLVRDNLGFSLALLAGARESRGPMLARMLQEASTVLTLGGAALPLALVAGFGAGLGGWRSTSMPRGVRLDGLATVALLALASLALAVAAARATVTLGDILS